MNTAQTHPGRNRLGRLKVGQRIWLGLLAMVSLVLLASLAAALTAARLLDVAQVFQQKTLPALDEAAGLARLGVVLDVATRDLVSAESQFELDAALFTLRKLSAELRGGLQRLPASAAGEAEVGSLLGLIQQFDQQLLEIQPLVTEQALGRDDRRKRLQQIQTLASTWSTTSLRLATDSPTQTTVLLRSLRLPQLMAATVASDDAAQVRDLQVELAVEIDFWRNRAAQGETVAMALLGALSGAGIDPSGAFDQRLQQLHRQFRIERLQIRMQSVLEGIARQADTLSGKLRLQVQQQVDSSRAQTQIVFWLLALLGSSSVAAALLVRRDLGHKVIRRLERLRNAMRAQVEGNEAVIDVGGDDEIAEMAQSVAYFARELGLRETAAIAAHQELLATQQQMVMQEKMASLGTLTAGVAHEINNPTNFADGAVQNLLIEHQRLHAFLRELAGDDADPDVLSAIEQRFDRIAEMANTAREGHERIKAIVRDLRQFTRLDQADSKAVAIAEPITATVNLVRTRFDRIEFRLQLDENPLIECQPARLSQVFLNLIVNACEAIESGPQAERGLLTIKTQLDSTQRLRVDISDNGCGMDASVRERIFEPFFTTKGVGSGTGLGLAIVFGIIKDHGGTIAVESTPGRGTRFRLEFPLPKQGINPECAEQPSESTRQRGAFESRD